MSIKTRWDQEISTPSIILQFDNEWTWREYREALEEAANLQRTIGQPIGLLHDVPPQVRLPDMFLSNISPYITCTYPVNIHTAAVVTPDLLSEMMLRAIIRIYGKDQGQYIIETAANLRAARQLIINRAQQLGFSQS